MGHTLGGGFALIVVLFILLIIVGALGYKSLSTQVACLTTCLSLVSLFAKGGYFMSGSHGDFGGGFALLVVLFILLIIIGASCFC